MATTQQYKITAPGTNKHVVATYHDGQLYALEGIHNLAHLWEGIAINSPIPLLELEIPANLVRYDGLVNIEKVEEGNVSQKIAKFCACFRHHMRFAYVMHKSDVASIKDVPVTDELMEAYFGSREWWGKQPKSIRNYATNINAVLQLAQQKKDPVSEFPMEYNAEFEFKLPAAKLPAYWKHLRQLGYSPVKNGSGKVTNWTKGAVVMISWFFVLTLVSGCMTPQRAARYVHQHPELFPSKTDTAWLDFVIEDTDTFYMEQDTFYMDWEWAGTDTTITWDTLRTQGAVAITNTASGKPRIRTEIISKADTLYQRDTVTVKLPGINKTIIIRKRVQNTWWWIALGGGLLILFLWRRKK